MSLVDCRLAIRKYPDFAEDLKSKGENFVVEKLGFDAETVNQAARLEARRRRLLAELEEMRQSVDTLIKIQRELEEEEIMENDYDARLHRRYKRLKEEAPYLSPLLEIERKVAGLFGIHY